MAMKSVHLSKGTDYEGTIPSGAVRLILTLGVQGQGEVVVGTGDPQKLYYGKNEYVLANGATSYTMKSDENLEVVEDFVFMPATVDAYVEQKFNELMGPINTKLEDHEARIVKLETAPGPPVAR